MNYENTTDPEINNSVKLLLISKHKKESDFDKFFLKMLELSNPNYCNSPADAWPIILENKISIMNDGDMWEASIDFDGDLGGHGTDEVLTKYYEHKNPLRAAMIVYLMMQEQK